MVDDFIKSRGVRWDLVNHVDDWTMRPALDWLISAGRAVTGLGDLTAGLAEALLTGGAPLVRIRVSSLTLHPLVQAWDGVWNIRTGVTQDDYATSLLTSSDYVGSPIQQIRDTGKPFRRRMSELAKGDHKLLHGLKATGATDYYATMLSNAGEMGGFASFVTDRPNGFDDIDIAKFETLVLFLSPVVDTVNRRRVATTLLDTYIGHRAGGRVLEGHIQRGDTLRIRAALWYSDLRDFSGISEDLPPEQVVDTLNTYFGVVGDAIMNRGGEVLQFIGDAVLAIFECEGDEADTRRACEAAFDAAEEALTRTIAINAQRRVDGLPEIRYGIGLHVGDVTFGNVGAATRLGFNVIGPAVNLTARLQSLSKEALVPLMLSQDFATMVRRALWQVGSYEIRGMRETRDVFTAAQLVEGAVTSG